MSAKYFDNTLNVDLESYQNAYKMEIEEIKAILGNLNKMMQEVQINRYLEELWRLFNLANGIIAKKEPWKLIKENKQAEVAELLIFVANLLIKGALCLYPCMPESAKKIMSVFGLEVNAQNYKNFVCGEEVLASVSLNPIPALFPKIEEICEVQKPVENKENKEALEPLKLENPITKDDFTKIEIKVGTIIEAEILPKSEKLLKLKVDLGESRARQILAGIKAYYTPTDLIGKQVCVLANLKPAKLMGEISEGMILAAKDDEGLAFIMPQNQRKNGSQIS